MNPLDNNTIINTPDGWRLLSGLRVGDAVLTQTGQRSAVSKLTEGSVSLLYEMVTQDNRVVPTPRNHRWKVWSVDDQVEMVLSANDLFHGQADGRSYVLPNYRPGATIRHLSGFLRTLPDAEVLYQGDLVIAIELEMTFDPMTVARLRERFWSYGAVLHIDLDVPSNQVRINAEFRHLMDFSIRETHRHCRPLSVILTGNDQTLLAKDYVPLILNPSASIPIPLIRNIP